MKLELFFLFTATAGLRRNIARQEMRDKPGMRRCRWREDENYNLSLSFVRRGANE